MRAGFNDGPARCPRDYVRYAQFSYTLAEPLKFGPPVEFEAEQGVRAVIAYIEKKPDRGREDFTTAALEALRTEWPCQ